MKIRQILKEIREFFWPMLDPLNNQEVREKNLDDCEFSNSDIDFALNVLDEYKKSEDSRRKDVEGKATVFIGTFAVATTILINLAKEFLINASLPANLFNGLIVFLIALTIVYLCKAIQYSIKALERKNYQSVGFPNFMFSDSVDKKRQILIKKYNAIKKNQDTINIKVDYMTMAQQFFKRAVVTVALLTGIFLCSYFFNSQNLLQSIEQIAQQISFNGWLIIIVFTIVLILILTTIILCRKINCIEERFHELQDK